MTINQTKFFSIFILCMNIFLLIWIPIQIKMQQLYLWPFIKASLIKASSVAILIDEYFYFIVIINVISIIALVIKEFILNNISHRIIIDIITLYFLIVFSIIIANAFIRVFPSVSFVSFLFSSIST